MDAKTEIEIPQKLKSIEADIRQWLKYKAEKRQSYKPTGIASMLKRWCEYQPSQVATAIKVAMTNNWDGCFPEKIPASNNGFITPEYQHPVAPDGTTLF